MYENQKQILALDGVLHGYGELLLPGDKMASAPFSTRSSVATKYALFFSIFNFYNKIHSQ